MLVNKQADGKYTIKNISLEYDIIEDAAFAVEVKNSFSNKTYPYTKIYRIRIEHFKKNDNWLNIDVNAPTVSLQALCLLFIDPDTRKPYNFKAEHFYNPNIENVKIQLDGQTSVLYDEGLKPEHLYDNAFNYFSRSLETDLDLNAFFVSKFCLLVDFRTLRSHLHHDSGVSLANKSKGISLYIQRKQSDKDEPISCYIYILQDSKIEFKNDRISAVMY